MCLEGGEWRRAQELRRRRRGLRRGEARAVVAERRGPTGTSVPLPRRPATSPSSCSARSWPVVAACSGGAQEQVAAGRRRRRTERERSGLGERADLEREREDSDSTVADRGPTRSMRRTPRVAPSRSESLRVRAQCRRRVIAAARVALRRAAPRQAAKPAAVTALTHRKAGPARPWRLPSCRTPSARAGPGPGPLTGPRGGDWQMVAYSESVTQWDLSHCQWDLGGIARLRRLTMSR